MTAPRTSETNTTVRVIYTLKTSRSYVKLEPEPAVRLDPLWQA